MNNQPRVILVASHLLLAVAGGWLAWQSAIGFSRHPSSATKQVQPGQAPGRGQLETAFYPTNEWHGCEYARAWKAVRNGNYTT